MQVTESLPKTSFSVLLSPNLQCTVKNIVYIFIQYARAYTCIESELRRVFTNILPLFCGILSNVSYSSLLFPVLLKGNAGHGHEEHKLMPY